MSGAGLSTLSAHRRPLATAAAAGGVLLALWFIPSAHANPDEPGRSERSSQGVSQTGSSAEDGTRTQLAETGTFDSTPFVIGGLGFVGVGGAVLAHAQHKTRPSPTASA